MAAECAEPATSDSLTGLAWEIILELCDIIDKNPGQAKDAAKVLKRRLGNKSPKIQLQALNVPEALSKNCWDSIRKQIVAQGILREMVIIVKKKPDLDVREKILVLIHAWKDAFGGTEKEYQALIKAAGVEFLHGRENIALLFTPPKSDLIAYKILL